MVVNSARIVSSPRANVRLCKSIIQRMEARAIFDIACRATREYSFNALIMRSTHRKNGQSPVKSAKSRFAYLLSSSMNSSAVFGTFGLRRCRRLDIFWMVIADARVSASSVSLILATSSSSRSRTMNSERPSVAFSREWK